MCGHERVGAPRIHGVGRDAVRLQSGADDEALGVLSKGRDGRRRRATSDDDRFAASRGFDALELFQIDAGPGAASGNDDGVGKAALEHVLHLAFDRSACKGSRVLDVDVGKDPHALGPERSTLAQEIVRDALSKTLKNEEVDDLSKFATSATGQAATQAYLKALDLTLESAANTLASEIIKGTK